MTSFCLRRSGRIQILALGLCSALPVPGADSLDAVRETATEWARIRSETVRLETEWRSQREILESTLTALKDRAVTLERERDLAQATAQADQQASAKLEEQAERARGQIDASAQRLQRITASLTALRPWLPPRLSDALELPFRTLADESLNPSERLQHALNVLNRCAQFNKSITFAEETLALEDDGTPRLLEVLYWGLSHAYAVDRDGARAYLGRPGRSRWEWEARPDITEEVERLVAVHQDKEVPEFITVPVRILETSIPVPEQ